MKLGPKDSPGLGGESCMLSNYPRSTGCPKCGKETQHDTLCRVCREGPLWKLPLLSFGAGCSAGSICICVGFWLQQTALILIPVGFVILIGTLISCSLILAAAIRRKLQDP